MSWFYCYGLAINQKEYLYLIKEYCTISIEQQNDIEKYCDSDTNDCELDDIIIDLEYDMNNKHITIDGHQFQIGLMSDSVYNVFGDNMYYVGHILNPVMIPGYVQTLPSMDDVNEDEIDDILSNALDRKPRLMLLDRGF